MSTVESIARPRRNGERRRAPTASISKRSEERFSRNAETDLVCRLLLEKKNEIFALLGPNGAGKTTLINIVCALITPSAGTVTLFFNDTAPTELSTLSLHDALPI